MAPEFMFIAAVLALLAIIMFLQRGRVSKLIRYLRSEEGAQPALGIKVVVGAFITLALLVFLIRSASAGECEYDCAKAEYFAFGEVYLGVDYPNETSPQCMPGEFSDRLTSNLGFTVNIVQRRDERFKVNLTGTHHSCAFNPDTKRVYNAVGAELVLRVW